MRKLEFLKSSKGKFLATAIIASGILLFILYEIVWGLFIKIRNSSYVISADSSSLQFLSMRSQAAEESEKAILNVAIEEEKIKKTIFDKDRPLEFIEALENIARISGSLIEITPIEGKDSLSTFLIAVEGDFPSLFKFLKLVEVMQYKISIEEANFEKRSGQSSLGSLAQQSLSAGSMRLNLTLKTRL